MTGPETVDAGALPGGGDGVQWTLEAASELNVNVVDLAPGHAIDEHVNDEVDVVVVVLAGEGTATVDGEAHPLAAQVLAHLPKGSRRRIEAAATGLRYVTVHRRRGPLSIGFRPG